MKSAGRSRRNADQRIHNLGNAGSHLTFECSFCDHSRCICISSVTTVVPSTFIQFTNTTIYRSSHASDDRVPTDSEPARQQSEPSQYLRARSWKRTYRCRLHEIHSLLYTILYMYGTNCICAYIIKYVRILSGNRTPCHVSDLSINFI